MEKTRIFFADNPHYFGIVFAIFGIVLLLSAVYNANWLFGKDVNSSTYSLKKLDGWINMFGRNTARIVIGIVSMISILAGITWFVLYSEKESPAILKAEYDGSVYMLYLTLREDGTYRINKPPCCEGVTSERYDGNYFLKGDSIILDRNIRLGSVSMSKEWTLTGDSIMFYTFFPYENIIHEDSLYFEITERK
jgi:hypothetical protein